MSGSGWIPRIGGCGPMWSGGRGPGTRRRLHPCSLWRGVVRNRSWRDAILTADLPTDAVPPAKTQAAPDCCRLTHPFIASITRRAGHDSVRPAHRPAGAGEVVPRGQGAGVIRAQHPSEVHCQRLTDRDRLPRAASQFIQVIHRPQPEAHSILASSPPPSAASQAALSHNAITCSERSRSDARSCR